MDHVESRTNTQTLCMDYIYYAHAVTAIAGG